MFGVKGISWSYLLRRRRAAILGSLLPLLHDESGACPAPQFLPSGRRAPFVCPAGATASAAASRQARAVARSAALLRRILAASAVSVERVSPVCAPATALPAGPRTAGLTEGRWRRRRTREGGARALSLGP